MFVDGAWTGGALLLPAIAAVTLLPVWNQIIHPFRMGVLLILIAILASANFIDFGIGRAVTRAIARARSRDEYELSVQLCYTGYKLSLIASALVGLLIGVFLVSSPSSFVFDTASPLSEAEVTWAPILAACAVAATIFSGGARGSAEGYELFKLVAIVRTFLGVMTFALPVLTALYSDSLVFSLLGLFLVRLFSASLFINFVFWKNLRHGLSIRAFLAARSFKPLVTTSVWLALSNLALLVFVVYDRVFVASVFGEEVVTVYATPLEIASKLTALTGAVSIVLFPRFASGSISTIIESKRIATKVLIGFGLPALIAAIFVAIFAQGLLSVWLNEEFAQQAMNSFRWQIATAYVAAMSVIFYGYAQARGIGRQVAIWQIIQAILFVLALNQLNSESDFEAVSAICFVRTLVDFLVLANLFFSDKVGGPGTVVGNSVTKS